MKVSIERLLEAIPHWMSWTMATSHPSAGAEKAYHITVEEVRDMQTVKTTFYGATPREAVETLVRKKIKFDRVA